MSAHEGAEPYQRASALPRRIRHTTSEAIIWCKARIASRSSHLHHKKRAPTWVPFSYGGDEGARTLDLTDVNRAL